MSDDVIRHATDAMSVFCAACLLALVVVLAETCIQIGRERKAGGKK